MIMIKTDKRDNLGFTDYYLQFAKHVEDEVTLIKFASEVDRDKMIEIIESIRCEWIILQD